MLIGGDAIGRPVIGQISSPQGAAAVPLITDWYQETPQLRDNIDARYRVALIASGMVRGDLFPIIPSFDYYANLSIPTTRPKLPAYQQQVLAYGTINPVVSFAYFQPLNEPKRFKPAFRVMPDAQPFSNFPLPGPAILLQGWYVAYSEPVRFKQGLGARFQQVLAYHPRILPKPNVTGNMVSVETNADIMLMAINVLQSQPPDSAVVSISEVSGGNSVTSVVEVGNVAAIVQIRSLVAFQSNAFQRSAFQESGFSI